MTDKFVEAAPEVTSSCARETALARAHVLDPKNADVLLELADLLVGQSRDRDAAAAFRQVLEDHPDHAAATYKLGNLLHEYPAFRDEAIDLLDRAVLLNSALVEAYRPLAWALNARGRRAEAVAVLRKWCLAAPNDPAAQHLLAAYDSLSIPERAADAFVKQTFDATCEHFETHLRNKLEYRGPEVLAALLEPHLNCSLRGSMRILDMGCGTGLCAPFLRPWAQTLTGIDLSSGMLTQARATGRYDALEEVELSSYLESAVDRGVTFDAMIAADTFIYFGRLDRLFALSIATLNPGGWLAFTVERAFAGDSKQTDEVTLDTTGRYKHSERHVRKALKNTGFSAPDITESQIRTESGVPVLALVVAAQRPQ